MSDVFLDKELLEQLKRLTLARLQIMPSDTELAIGSDRYTKSELVKHVSAADVLGRQMMSMQLEFLRDLASGEIYKDDNLVNTAQA